MILYFFPLHVSNEKTYNLSGSCLAESEVVKPTAAVSSAVKEK